MTFGSYRISTIFFMLAIVFFVVAVTLENPVFIGSVVVCLIFGAKKVKDVPKNNNQDA